jgi:2-polyprenyl-6-methoxyphenol hydroxylase-like FAD-dependent oxidoreductase
MRRNVQDRLSYMYGPNAANRSKGGDATVRVLVAGGGIAGLGAAVALTQRGIEVDLVERNPAWRTNGAGIMLNPNGERALRALGLDAAVLDAGFRVETMRIMDATGSELGVFPAEHWSGIGGVIAIHRDALQQVLLEAASGSHLTLGSSVSGIDDDGSHVNVTMADGSKASYSLVVIAEGIRSTTRDAVFGTTEPRPVGQTYWRTAVNDELVDMLTMVNDRDRYVSVLPLGKGRTYVAVQTHSIHPDVPRDERIATMRAACAGLAGPVPAVLDAVRSDDDVFVNVAEEMPTILWRRSRVVVIGDAAHALSPSFGQGANLALEDAVVLADELAARDDVIASLDAFVARRDPRVRFVHQKTAERIALVNRGASQRDLAAAVALVSEHLKAPI